MREAPPKQKQQKRFHSPSIFGVGWTCFAALSQGPTLHQVAGK
jgi:hypothetical protein